MENDLIVVLTPDGEPVVISKAMALDNARERGHPLMTSSGMIKSSSVDKSAARRMGWYERYNGEGWTKTTKWTNRLKGWVSNVPGGPDVITDISPVKPNVQRLHNEAWVNRNKGGGDTRVPYARSETEDSSIVIRKALEQDAKMPAIREFFGDQWVFVGYGVPGQDEYKSAKANRWFASGVQKHLGIAHYVNNHGHLMEWLVDRGVPLRIVRFGTEWWPGPFHRAGARAANYASGKVDSWAKRFGLRGFGYNEMMVMRVAGEIAKWVVNKYGVKADDSDSLAYEIREILSFYFNDDNSLNGIKRGRN